MKVGVKIFPRPEVLDTQGRAVGDTLRRMGLEIKACTIGRYIVLDFEVPNKDEALTRAKKMADLVLCNSLIETFELELL